MLWTVMDDEGGLYYLRIDAQASLKFSCSLNTAQMHHRIAFLFSDGLETQGDMDVP
jgi:hypothetical protein